MDNEILKALSSLLDEKLKSINEKLENLEEGQKRIENKLDGVVDQTADLTEFKTTVLESLEDIKAVEEVTKANCYEIAKLKVVK